MKLYQGTYQGEIRTVKVDGLPLANREDLLPLDTGLAWGDSGFASSALARAILIDALDSDHLAAEFASDFLTYVIAKLPQSCAWEMTQGEIWRWIIKQCERRYDEMRRRGPTCLVV